MEAKEVVNKMEENNNESKYRSEEEEDANNMDLDLVS
jgi:hypothetical protein